MTASLSISLSAAPGLRAVTITLADDSSNSLTAGFTVIPPPTLVSVSPASGTQGTALNVTLIGTGLDTLTSCDFGAGITASCTASSATQATASLSSSAATGPRAVSVTTFGGSSTLPSGFTVNIAIVVLFQDPFNGKSLSSSWTATSGWSVKSGTARGQSALGTAIVNVTPPDHTVQAAVSLSAGGTGSGVIARFSGTSYYAAVLRSTGNVDITRTVGGTTTTLGTVARTIQANTAYTLRLNVSGQTEVQLTASINGAAVLSVSDTSASRLTAGKSGLLSGTTSLTTYDDFLLQTP